MDDDDENGASLKQKKFAGECGGSDNCIGIFYSLFRFSLKVLISYGNLKYRRPTGRSLLTIRGQVEGTCLRLLVIYELHSTYNTYGFHVNE